MALLTYGLVAASLAALVSGFFVTTTSLPLYVSIALSVAAAGLIVFGWARRLREERELEALADVDITTQLPVLEELEESTADGEPADEPEADEPEADEPEAEPPTPAAPRGGGGKRVVLLPGRNRYHATGCRFADRPGAERVTVKTARARGAEPCSVCLRD